MYENSAHVDITNRRMERMFAVIRGDKVRYDGPHTRQKSLTLFYNYTLVVPTSLIGALVNVKRTCCTLFQRSVTMKESGFYSDLRLCCSGE